MDADTSLLSENGRNLPEAPSTELQAIEAAYREVTRRDTTLEREKWHWKIGACVLLGTTVAFAAATLFLALKRANVHPFVQTVQVNERGVVQPLGVPVELLDYTPQDGQWLDMLGEWIRRVRWRGTDAVQAKEDWKWAYLHTCGAGRRYLQHVEDREKPFVLTTTLRAVSLLSITKNPAPLSYQAHWEEVTTEAHAAPTVERWTGTFTVGRLMPPTQDAVLMNRLGLCVGAFDLSKQP